MGDYQKVQRPQHSVGCVLSSQNKKKSVCIILSSHEIQQLALPKPLEYTHGASIPFYLSIATQDRQLRELLSVPENWSFYLTKHTALLPNTPAAGNVVSNPIERSGGGGGGGGARLSSFTDTVSRGRAWRTEGSGQSDVFAICGDIVIPRGSTPTFEFPSIGVYVSNPLQHTLPFCLPPKIFQPLTQRISLSLYLF